MLLTPIDSEACKSQHCCVTAGPRRAHQRGSNRFTHHSENLPQFQEYDVEKKSPHCRLNVPHFLKCFWTRKRFSAKDKLCVMINDLAGTFHRDLSRPNTMLYALVSTFSLTFIIIQNNYYSHFPGVEGQAQKAQTNC